LKAVLDDQAYLLPGWNDRRGNIVKVQAAMIRGQSLEDFLRSEGVPLDLNGKNFISVKGNSITSPTLYYRVENGKVTGQGYILKPPDSQYQTAQESEMVQSILMQKLGFPYAAARKDGGQSIVMELGGNVADGQMSWGDYKPEKVAWRGRIHQALANTLFGNADRHPGNAMYYVDADGVGQAMPIDFGRGFLHRYRSPEQAADYVLNMGFDYGQWWREENRRKSVVERERIAKEMMDATKEFIAAMDNLGDISESMDAVVASMGNQLSARAKANMVELANSNIAMLKSPEFLAAMKLRIASATSLSPDRIA